MDKVNQNNNQIVTLQSIKKLSSDSEATTKIILKETQFGTFLIIANAKGFFRCFNVNFLIKEHYSQKEKPQIKRQSPSMYRNSKSQYQYELQKNKHEKLHISKIKNSTKQSKNCFQQVWNFGFTNKQPITGINFIDMNNVYICAGTSDGYYKIFNLCEGNLFGTIKMNLPLPMLWDIKIQKDLFIKKNVYQTLMILDRILTNKGFSMISKQYKSVNITEFLQMISMFNKEQNSSQHLKKSQKQIHLLHEQYTIEDLKGIKPKQNTIKELQAYKRVKLIKEKMSEGNQKQEEKQQYRNINERQATEFINKKQQVQKLLSPNYFPSLKDQGNSNKFKANLQVASIESRSQILMDKIKMKKNFTPQYMNLNNDERNGSIDKQNIFELPSLNSTIKNKQISKTVAQKNDKTLNQNKQNVFSMVLSIPSLFKDLKGNNSLSNLASNMTQSKIIKKQNKFVKSTLPSKRHTLDDKPIKQILNEIDQKLNIYKKLSYGKRRII